MGSQLLSPCITVLLEGLQGESQDEVREASACRPRAEAFRGAIGTVEALPWLSSRVKKHIIRGCVVSTIGYTRSLVSAERSIFPGTGLVFFQAPGTVELNEGTRGTRLSGANMMFVLCMMPLDGVGFHFSFRANLTRALHAVCAFPSIFPRLAPACLARYETCFAPATRAAAQTKRPDRSLPPRCRYGVFSPVLVVATPGCLLENQATHSLSSVKHAVDSTLTPRFCVLTTPCVWIGAFRGGWRYLGAAGGAGQGQLGTTHCQGGRVRGRGCLGRRRQRTSRGADRTGGGGQFTCFRRVKTKSPMQLVRSVARSGLCLVDGMLFSSLGPAARSRYRTPC